MTVEFEPDDWERFAHSVCRTFRYIISPSICSGSSELDSNQRFLVALHDSSRSRIRKMEKGATFWRAQLDGTWRPVIVELPESLGGNVSREALLPHDRDRMIPFPDRATEGRVNPKGIPCLYVATDPRTAMSEVKPALGSHITVAEFRTVRDLNLVDCTVPPGPFLSEQDYARAMEMIAWADLNDAFSVPVTASESAADYAPTQIVAEVFKCAGYDGVMYKSGLDSHGLNIALFDPGNVEFKEASLHRVMSVEFDFQKLDEPVFHRRPPSTE